jgi:hypothetical protein
VHRKQPLAFGPAGSCRGRAQPEALAGTSRQDTLETEIVEQALQPEVIDLRDAKPRRYLAKVYRARIAPEQIQYIGACRKTCQARREVVARFTRVAPRLVGTRRAAGSVRPKAA